MDLGSQTGVGGDGFFFGYHIMLQTAMGRDTDGLFIILARARLERVFFSIFEEI